MSTWHIHYTTLKLIHLRYTGGYISKLPLKRLYITIILAAYHCGSIFSGLNGHFRISRGVLVLRSRVMVSAPLLPNAHAYYCPAPPLSLRACALSSALPHVNEIKVHWVAAGQVHVSVHGVYVCVCVCVCVCLWRIDTEREMGRLRVPLS